MQTVFDLDLTHLDGNRWRKGTNAADHDHEDQNGQEDSEQQRHNNCERKTFGVELAEADQR